MQKSFMSSEKLIDRFMKKTGLILAVRFFCMSLIAGFFIYGTVVLVLRSVFMVSRDVLLWPMLAVAVLFAAALWWGYKNRPSRKAVRALLDSRSCAGGLVMAQEQVDVEAWRGKIPELETPEIKWKFSRQAGLLSLSILFLLLGFVIPQRYISAQPGSLDISNDVDRITEKIETLEELEIIDQTQAEEMQEQLSQIQDSTNADDPVKTWESLDHVENKTSDIANQAANETLQAMENLSKAEALSKAMSMGAGELSESQKAMAMEELSQMLEDSKELSDALSQACENAGQCAKDGGCFSKEQFDQLCEAISQCKGGMCSSLKDLKNLQMIDAELLKEAMECMDEFDPDALDALIACMKSGECDGEKLMGMCAGCNKPGRGGVTRGRGDAEMTWNANESDESGSKFKATVLPPASLQAFKQSKLAGISTADPTKNQPAGASNTTTLDATKFAAGSANTQKILPRHRKAVKNYFQREKSKK